MRVVFKNKGGRFHILGSKTEEFNSVAVCVLKVEHGLTAIAAAAHVHESRGNLSAEKKLSCRSEVVGADHLYGIGEPHELHAVERRGKGNYFAL